VHHCRYYHPLGREIRRTGFGFDSPKITVKKKLVTYEVGLLTHGPLRGNLEVTNESSFMGDK
jgi:hypothetical protein